MTPTTYFLGATMEQAVQKPKVETIKISYSKAQAFKSCEYKFWLAHVRKYADDSVKPGLMPHEKSEALRRGTHGHLMMEWFHNEVKDTLKFPYDPQECSRIMASVVARGMIENPEDTGTVMKQMMHYGANVFPHKNWRILEVEKEYRLEIGIDPVSGKMRVVPITVDLVVMIGNTMVIIDHKFSADAYKDDRVEIEPQLPIYMGLMRARGLAVRYGIYNFMRTRKMNNVEEQVVQKRVDANDVRIKQSFKDHLKTIDKIVVFQRQIEVAVEAGIEPDPTRSVSNNCDYCDFRRICKTALKGEDTTAMIEHGFEANDYGYEDL
jgi:CRISPR/Cas system-associated exonuclease Cas4 (RecB family)